MTESAPKVFVCQQCGECCRGEGGILLSDLEVERLARFCGMTGAEFQQRYVQRSPLGPALAVGPKGACVFNAGGRCRVHAVKPRICREWPFFPAILVNEDEWESAKAACPGITSGCTHADFLRWWRKKVV